VHLESTLEHNADATVHLMQEGGHLLLLVTEKFRHPFRFLCVCVCVCVVLCCLSESASDPNIERAEGVPEYKQDRKYTKICEENW
jgi:hypothetical protein